jgi:membrane protein
VKSAGGRLVAALGVWLAGGLVNLLFRGSRRVQLRYAEKAEDVEPRPRKAKRSAWGLLKATLGNWSDDRAPKMAAALAYYTAFAIAPLLLIAIAVAGLLFGQDAARGEVGRQLDELIGKEGGAAVQQILQRAWRPKSGILATVLGVAALLVASTGVFAELQDSLNTVWKVRKKPGRGLLGTLKDRFLSFSMVLGIGFLLLVSLVLTAALEALGNHLAGPEAGILLRILNLAVSFGVIAFLFAAMFRLLPDAETRWKEAWIGGALTALLFSLGKFAIGLYLGRSAVGSTYGAAGSFVVFLIWVNYSAQIVFLGAEFTKSYADVFGQPPEPDPDAVPIEVPPAGRPQRRSPATNPG